MRTLALFLLAACAVLPAPAQRLEIVCTQAVLDAATISDVDFVRSTTPKWLFTIELRTVPAGSTISNVVLLISGDLALASGEVARNVIQMTTTAFTVTGSRILTNFDLARADLRGDYRFDDGALTEIGVRDVALASTKLPAGVYTLRVQAYQRQNGTDTDIGRPKNPIIFDLRNPSSVELLLPADGETAVGLYPLFQWLYDGTESRIAVFERLPGQGSLEETIGGVPHLREEVTGHSFQYPSAGVRALQPGSTYVWYVDGLSRSSGGTLQPIRSLLRSFTVATRETPTPESSILDALELALGPQYKPLFDRLRADRMTATGAFRLNDSTLTTDQLLQFISTLRRSPELVRGAYVE